MAEGVIARLNLHVLHTNDVHSELDSYARLATKLRSLRHTIQDHGDPVLSFDLGDHIDLVNNLSEATQGRVNADILRAIGVDGWVLGNNETVTVPQEAWPELVFRSGAPLFCSNVSGIGDANLTHGRLIQYPDVTVGVFGVTVRYENLMQSIGVEASDPVEVAWQIAQELRASGADVVIMLSHLGLHMDQILADDGLPVNLIIGSHTHQYLEHGIQKNGIWMVQAGKQARAFGHTMLHISDGQVVQVSAELVYTDPLESPDEAVIEAIAQHEVEAAGWLNEPVAVLDQPLPHELFDESSAVNVLCDQARVACQVDLALINGGVLHAALGAGVVRRKDVSGVCGTPMRMVTMTLSGAQLLALLSQGLVLDIIMQQGFGFGFRGHFIGRLHISGARILTTAAIDEQGRTNERITHIEVNGVPLHYEAFYRVAVCEFVALSAVYTTMRGTNFTYHPEPLRSMLYRALANPILVGSGREYRYHRQEDESLI